MISFESRLHEDSHKKNFLASLIHWPRELDAESRSHMFPLRLNCTKKIETISTLCCHKVCSANGNRQTVAESAAAVDSAIIIDVAGKCVHLWDCCCSYSSSSPPLENLFNSFSKNETVCAARTFSFRIQIFDFLTSDYEQHGMFAF